jgi:hypothetical protein
MTEGRDFFVSYAQADRAWAEWIAEELETAGYSTLLQAWDFRPGEDFVHEMQRVVSMARRTIAVLSPAYVSSAFGEAQWRAAFASDPTGEQGLLLPVRVEPVDPPGLLRTRVYVDLVGLDEASARSALLAAAGGTRGRPSREPMFPGGPAASAAGTSRFPQELQGVGPVAASRIFISYRREQAGGLAGRLYDRLADKFGEAQVFMDVDSIEPGVDFAEVIERAVASCDVLLAVIGPGWLAAKDDAGQRRLDDPDDLVRLEVEAALARNVRVIPVLVEGAPMPRRQNLPESLSALARRNAFILRNETFRADAPRLVELLDRFLSSIAPK